MNLYAKKGSYVLILSLVRPVSVQVGKLGEFTLDPGTYLYVGSALGTGSTSLHHRLTRHFLKEKPLKWHIDFITTLPQTKLHAVVVLETSSNLECQISEHISRLDDVTYPISGFGSSDCSQCKTHFYFSSNPIMSMITACEQIIRGLGFTPKIILAES